MHTIPLTLGDRIRTASSDTFVDIRNVLHTCTLDNNNLYCIYMYNPLIKGMECRVSPSEQIVKHFNDKDANKNKTISKKRTNKKQKKTSVKKH